MESTNTKLDRLLERIGGFGKENLEEMLHGLAEGVRLAAGRERVRIYLEDLTRGALSCAYASGPKAAEIAEVTFPIVSPDAMVSAIFISRFPAEQTLADGESPALDRVFADRFGIASSYLIPLTNQGKSLGVVCIDSEDAESTIDSDARGVLREFIGSFGEKLDHARQYHQQLLLARRVEEYKKREAAGFMVESAVRLIDRLSLASVLVPVTGPDGKETLKILASHSEDPLLKAQFDEPGEIALEKGESLISRYLNDRAVIIDDRLLKPLFIPDLTAQHLQKLAITEKMALRSLYVVPRYEPATSKVICLVNYFTREIYRFSEFEMGLLQTHAEMVERVIHEIGGEHPEIKVLAEITDLLQEPNEGLQPFLTKVLSKATELIGADTGSIAIVEVREGDRWLVVEDDQGTIVGAKNKEEHKRILQIIDRLTSRHISDIQRIERLQVEVTRLQSDVTYKDPQVSSYRLGNIIGNSHKAREIVDFINTVSVPLFNRIAFWSNNIIQEATIGLPSILLLGPTGAGKEFFFNNLYNKLNEMYRDKINPHGELAVKKTNIAAYSGELTFSELFGHKKGAFTGAYSDRKGILEEARGGVVFLDEIGDADPKTQVQLLRFLDNGGFFRLGDNQERYSRVLLVAATNKNLAEEISRGNFREDLYHRLSELSVRVPSLNERREDIPDLATHFLGKLYRTYRGKDEARDEAPTLTEEAKQVLVGYHYKGN